jgi:acetyltransferase-like isoleucine patch superfamily enzyme
VPDSTPPPPAEQPSHPSFRLAWRPAAALRFTWMVVSIAAVETAVFGLSIVPAAYFWDALSKLPYPVQFLRTLALSMAIAPAYLMFAVLLMVLSAGSMRLFGWRTPPDARMPVAEFGWPLLGWGRYMVSTHVVRLFAGSVLRATPLWTFYLRLNGARLGRGVYVNSLFLSDHNLLEFDDYVVIGDGVHLSGHTVERGVVLTGRVRLGRSVTIGLGSVVSIDVEAGPRCQVGALSFVPKHSRLEGDTSYLGTPVARLMSHRTAGDAAGRAGRRPRAARD